MTDYKTPMEVDDESRNPFELASVSIEQWNDQIDANVGTFHASMYNNYKGNLFSESLSFRGEISKLCASIGSCNISDDNTPCSLFDRPKTATIADIEKMLPSLIEPNEME